MKKKTLAWGGYLLAVHIALAAAILSSNTAAKILSRAGLRPPPDQHLVPWLRPVHERLDATVPEGAVLFLGDSIMMALATSAVAPVSENFAIGGQRSDQLLVSMDSYHSMKRARAVVVMIGANDLLQEREDGIEARYRAILAKVPAGVAVVLSTIPPIHDDDAPEVAQAARTVCAADPRCRLVDAFSALQIDGAMDPDGIHLTPKGYQVWIGLLRQAVGAGQA